MRCLAAYSMCDRSSDDDVMSVVILEGLVCLVGLVVAILGSVVAFLAILGTW